MTLESTLNLTVIKTDDGSDTVYWPQYGESFHTGCGALTETQQLYMIASGFKERLHLHPGLNLSVLDVGLGLGYNALETIGTWYLAPQPGNLTVTSLEMSAGLVTKLTTLTGEWMSAWSEQWLNWTRAARQINANLYKAEIMHPSGVICSWWIVVADASQLSSLPVADYDYVWQDAFSPKRNPEMWTRDWFAKVNCWCKVDGLIASYSCARIVKDAMQEAGWKYRRIKGAIGKRHWLLANKINSEDGDQSLPLNTSAETDISQS